MKQTLLAAVLLCLTASFAIANEGDALKEKETPKQQFQMGSVIQTAKPVVCTHFQMTLDQLSGKKFNETLVGIGNSDNSASDESKIRTMLFLNPENGGYTVVEVFSNSMACVLATGTGMQIHLPKDYNPTSYTGGQKINYEIHNPVNAVVQ